MKIGVELEGWLLKLTSPITTHAVETVAEADGVCFLCPKCFSDGGRVGTHSIICWKPHIPQDIPPRPGRWAMMGNTILDLTLEPSVNLDTDPQNCKAHFFIRNGEIQ